MQTNSQPNKDVIGIDPGTTESALVQIDSSYKVVNHLYLPNKEILDYLYSALDNNDEDIPHLGIEFMQSYGMGVGKDVFITLRWIGRFEEVFSHMEDSGIEVFLFSRPTILNHITGGIRGKSKAKSFTRKALMERLGGTKKKEPLNGITQHKWDALAVAVFVMDGLKFDNINSDHYGRIR